VLAWHAPLVCQGGQVDIRVCLPPNACGRIWRAPPGQQLSNTWIKKGCKLPVLKLVYSHENGAQQHLNRNIQAWDVVLPGDKTAGADVLVFVRLENADGTSRPGVLMVQRGSLASECPNPMLLPRELRYGVIGK
jgi:hypothetical protein